MSRCLLILLLVALTPATPLHAEYPPEEILSWPIACGVENMVASHGSIFVTDLEEVYRFEDGALRAGQGGPTPVGPMAVSVRHDGMVYVSEGVGYPSTSWWIQVFDFDLQPDHVLGRMLPESEFHVWNLAHDAEGNLYVADGQDHVILKFDPEDRIIHEWGAEEGTGPGEFGSLGGGMAVTQAGELLVCDYQNERIQRFDLQGAYLGEITMGERWRPTRVAVGPDGHLYVASWDTITRISKDGAVVTEWTVRDLMAVAVDDDGYVYVAAGRRGECRIYKYDNKPGRPPKPRYRHDSALVLHVESLSKRLDCEYRGWDADVVSTAAALPEHETAFRVFVLAAPNSLGDLNAGVTGAQFGIEYPPDEPSGTGVAVTDWRRCSLLEFADRTWPETGSNITLTWSTTPLTCQRRDLVNLGYFDIVVRTPSTMRIRPFSHSGLAKIVNCSGAEDVVELSLPQTSLGWVSLGGASLGSVESGCNPMLRPCDETVAVQAMTWGGVKRLLGGGR